MWELSLESVGIGGMTDLMPDTEEPKPELPQEIDEEKQEVPEETSEVEEDPIFIEAIVPVTCVHEGIEYPHNSDVADKDPCKTCFCDNGRVICASQSCAGPPEGFQKAPHLPGAQGTCGC